MEPSISPDPAYFTEGAFGGFEEGSAKAKVISQPIRTYVCSVGIGWCISSTFLGRYNVENVFDGWMLLRTSCAWTSILHRW
jgi:hypothetical protein